MESNENLYQQTCSTWVVSLIALILIVSSCSKGAVSLNDKQCYKVKRIATACPSYAYLQIIGDKAGSSWTYGGVTYDNVITVTNYVDSVKTDTIYILIAKSVDPQLCVIDGFCTYNLLGVTPPITSSYCLNNVSSIQCPMAKI